MTPSRSTRNGIEPAPSTTTVHATVGDDLSQQARVPKPNKLSVLERLIAHVPITSVVDVGVRECTGELITAFPGIKHYLFEPVSLFFDRIKKNYSRIDYELMPFALSDEDTQIYLVLSSLNNDGTVTHSKIENTPVETDGKKIVACSPVQVRRFETCSLERPIAKNFLLKVDVDGKDLEVVRGFGSRLRDASAIVIECTSGSFVPRATYITSQGFFLVDIVDMIYYGDSLYQFDAVFVRNDLATEGLCPPIKNFKQELWKQA
jgi:FkbM family methyltransferase